MRHTFVVVMTAAISVGGFENLHPRLYLALRTGISRNEPAD